MNRYLLDTNILVFLVGGDTEEISRDVMAIIEDYNNRLEASTVSLIELTQLYRIGKIKLRKGQSIEDILDLLKTSIDIHISDFTENHINTLANLEAIEGHNDPFDHAIIAHAITDRYALISSDSKFRHYKDQNLNFVFNKR